MKKLVLLICGIVISVSLFSQAEYKSNQADGYIMDKKEKKTEGVIEINGNEENPWNNQKIVKYIPTEVFETGKVKNKQKEKHKPGEIKEYKFGDRVFESVKFSDMSAAGTGMIPKWYFLERFCDGKIQIYKYYETPMAVGMADEVEASRVRCLNEYQYVIVKDGSKPKNVVDVDIKEYIGDNQEVYDKYMAGEYGLKPLDKEGKKGVGKFVSRVLDANLLGSQILEIIDDYNKTITE